VLLFFEMRRVQIILVIVSLACAPLSLLVQPASADMSACGGMCCLPHHGSHAPMNHPANHQPAPPSQNHHVASCDHGSAPVQMPECALHCSDTQTQHVYVAPVAPTKPSNLTVLARLNLPHGTEILPETRDALPGFLATPFQPPRA
jgi:hypothetical protein